MFNIVYAWQGVYASIRIARDEAFLITWSWGQVTVLYSHWVGHTFLMTPQGTATHLHHLCGNGLILPVCTWRLYCPFNLNIVTLDNCWLFRKYIQYYYSHLDYIDSCMSSVHSQTSHHQMLLSGEVDQSGCHLCSSTGSM